MYESMAHVHPEIPNNMNSAGIDSLSNTMILKRKNSVVPAGIGRLASRLWAHNLLPRRVTHLLTMGLLVAGLGTFGVAEGMEEAPSSTPSTPTSLPIDAKSCRLVTGMPGTEDVTFDRDLQKAFVSSDDRRATLAGKPVRGEIYLFNPEEPTAAPVALTHNQPSDFHPHGISLYKGPDGKKRLFVINHRETGGHFIEIFDVLGADLKHAESLQFPELKHPNDIQAVGERQFYVSNDTAYQKGLGFYTEALLSRPWGNIVFYDGEKGSIAAGRLAYANGLALSPDGYTLYAAEVTGKSVDFFDRDPKTNRLSLRKKIHVGTGADNIELDAQGRLWVASHPNSLKFIGHAGDAAKYSPSRMLRITPGTGEVELVMDHDGSIISAVATSAVNARWIVLGDVFDAKLLLCPRPN